MALDLYEELRRVTQALDNAGLAYAVAGGIAVAVHGAPRATADIDLLIRPEDAAAAASVIEALGYPLPGGPVRFDDGTVLWRRTRVEDGMHLTVDLMHVDDNLRDAWESRTSVPTDWGALCVVSREALIRMKVAAGRPRDLDDAQRLTEADR